MKGATKDSGPEEVGNDLEKGTLKGERLSQIELERAVRFFPSCINSPGAARWLVRMIFSWVALISLIGTGTGFAQEVPTIGGNKDVLQELQKQVGEPVPTTTDLQELCVYYHKRGRSHFKLGNYQQAVSDFQKALTLNQSSRLTPNWLGDADAIRKDLLRSYSSAGDLIAYMELLKTMAAMSRNSNVRQYFYNTGTMIDAYVALGLLNEAEAALEEMTLVLPDVRRRADWATYGSNVMDWYSRYRGFLLALRGNLSESERFRRAALEYAQKFDSDVRHLSDKDSIDVWTAGRNVTHTTRQLADVLAAQGKLTEAEYLAREAIARTVTQMGFSTADTSDVFSTLSWIKVRQGRIAEALQYGDLAVKSMSASETKPHSTRLARVRGSLGSFLAMNGDRRQAVMVFEERDRGLRSDPEQFDKTGSAHLDWAMAMLKTGGEAQGTAMLAQLIERTQKRAFSDPHYIAMLHGYYGIALAGQGRDGESLEQFQHAIPELLANLKGRMANGDASDFLEEYRFRIIVEGYLALLARISALPAPTGTGFDAAGEAFRLADVARNSSVQRAIVASAARITLPDAELAGLARQEQDAGSRVQSLSKILGRLASSPQEDRLMKVMSDIQRDIVSLTEQRGRLRKEIEARFPEYADLVDPRPPYPADVQKLLAPDESMISIYSGEQQSYVWAFGRGFSNFRVVPITYESLIREVTTLRHSVDSEQTSGRPFDTATAYRLYSLFLAPDENLWGNAKVLNLIPHGPLAQIPFSMLLTKPVAPAQEGRSMRLAELPWMAKKVAIAQQSSASGFLALRRRASDIDDGRRPFVGFGDPIFMADSRTGGQISAAGDKRMRRNLIVNGPVDDDAGALARLQQNPGKLEAQALRHPMRSASELFEFLPQLPDTAIEVREIARTLGADEGRDVFLGSRATESNVKSADLKSYRVVEFATHGLVPGQLSGIDEPALALSNPALTADKDNDGFLTLEEVLALKLNADWVVLSACNTASSDGARNEAVSGLGRAFFFAGTRRLLVSNWGVETVSARLLTTALFRAQAETPMISPAEALRQAMIKVMADSSDDFSHPMFWAPFTLFGNGLSH